MIVRQLSSKRGKFRYDVYEKEVKKASKLLKFCYEKSKLALFGPEPSKKAEYSLFKPHSVLEHALGNIKLSQLECIKDEVMFPGNIRMIQSETDEESVSDLMENAKLIGVDTEFLVQPVHLQDKFHVSLVQIAVEDTVLLYRLKYGEVLSPRVQRLFADPYVIKVGHDIFGDMKQLYRSKHMPNTAHSLICTMKISKKLGCRKPGIKTMCPVLLQQGINKDQQRSDWEAPILTEEQQRYAATDAWLPRELLLQLIELHPWTHDSIKIQQYPMTRQELPFDASLIEHIQQIAKPNAMFGPLRKHNTNILRRIIFPL